MTEWKLFKGEVPEVSTAMFHADRPRAPHLEQEWHRDRLHLAAQFVHQAAESCGGAFVSDLGCGDGGLLSLVQKDDQVLRAWGYDFCPANEAGWRERGVRAEQCDVFGTEWDLVEIGTIVVMTEVLEHLADPHGVLRRIRTRNAVRLVCSSPWNENDQQHDSCHAWAWNPEGYARMIQSAGWTILRHEQAGLFQVVLAE